MADKNNLIVYCEYEDGKVADVSLEILTKDAESTYEEYIKHIKDDYPYHPEAYWVKLADIKDHLCQTETLTDKLKEKYIAVMPYLL